MKRFLFIMTVLLCAALTSCTPDKPEPRKVPDEVPPIAGFWSLLDADSRTDSFISFYMGKCMHFSCGGVHVVDQDEMWSCTREMCIMEKSEAYDVKDGKLLLGGVESGTVKFSGDDVSGISIDGRQYTKFNSFTEKSHASEIVSDLVLDNYSLSMYPGMSAQIKATILPEIVYDKRCSWSSSSPGVATVDDNGLVTAVNPGQAEIMVTTRLGALKSSCHVIVSPDVSAGGRANCYIVPSSGWFGFDARYKGNSEEKIEGAVEAIQLWSSSATTSAPAEDCTVSSCSYNPENGYISFYAGDVDGNVIVALRDADGNILWSWHLWVCMGYDPDLTAQVCYNDAGIIMDRNLGALSVKAGSVPALGLVYQWGRKDPFPSAKSRACKSNAYVGPTTSWVHEGYQWTSKDAAQSYGQSVSEPMTFFGECSSNNSWTAELPVSWESENKSMYDPCPAGWRVMSGGPDGLVAKATGITTRQEIPNFTFDYYNDGINFCRVLGDSDKMWFPFVGPMHEFQYKGMGWYGYWWTRTVKSSDQGRKPYMMYTYRNGADKTSMPLLEVDQANSGYFAYAIRCEKEVTE